MRDIVWILVVILVIGWLVGFVAFPDVGGIIHVILVIALILVVYKLLTGRKL
ncbi:lmo0937 family membrane protein [Zobellia laminariae]|uniref:lmo0937 family membrane protein n=1 Tax=Zobellia laminariae TaxID=248906 RepID=UPI0012DA00B4|nr:lmo0937 family membrane protein [Zobellia laminariae]